MWREMVVSASDGSNVMVAVCADKAIGTRSQLRNASLFIIIIVDVAKIV